MLFWGYNSNIIIGGQHVWGYFCPKWPKSGDSLDIYCIYIYWQYSIYQAYLYFWSFWAKITPYVPAPYEYNKRKWKINRIRMLRWNDLGINISWKSFRLSGRYLWSKICINCSEFRPVRNKGSDFKPICGLLLKTYGLRCKTNIF